MLDLLVGGCSVLFAQVVKPTQPDAADPSAPAAGGGAPYALQSDASHHVAACRDEAGTAVPLADCLNVAAYSTYMRFATDRVIVK
jgi:hypothetical protein